MESEGLGGARKLSTEAVRWSRASVVQANQRAGNWRGEDTLALQVPLLLI